MGIERAPLDLFREDVYEHCKVVRTGNFDDFRTSKG